jgi:1,2-phenylacetyl-CoA epoxidase catalytic subunit
MQDEESLLSYLAAGGKLSSPGNATPRYRGEIMRFMAVFVDSEMAGASGFADCINLAPSLRERIVAARIVLEKFGHAEQVLRLMEQFGAQTTLYVSAHQWAARLDRNAEPGEQRGARDMRLGVFYYPIFGWVDAMVMNFLMGRATVIQLDETSRCSYQPLADVMLGILPVEKHHAELGEEGVRTVLEAGHDPTAVQASVNYWYPRVAATFGRAASDHFEKYRQYGLRQRSNEELLALWQTATAATLDKLKLQVPTQLVR